MGLDVAFIKHGLTLDNHGRPVTTLIDKEMDRMKLVDRNGMGVSVDQEMDWSNRHMRELSWKWNMMRTFIIQMSIRSSLVGPGTRWIEPKKELFERPLSPLTAWPGTGRPAWRHAERGLAWRGGTGHKRRGDADLSLAPAAPTCAHGRHSWQRAGLAWRHYLARQPGRGLAWRQRQAADWPGGANSRLAQITWLDLAAAPTGAAAPATASGTKSTPSAWRPAAPGWLAGAAAPACASGTKSTQTGGAGGTRTRHAGRWYGQDSAWRGHADAGWLPRRAHFAAPSGRLAGSALAQDSPGAGRDADAGWPGAGRTRWRRQDADAGWRSVIRLPWQLTAFAVIDAGWPGICLAPGIRLLAAYATLTGAGGRLPKAGQFGHAVARRRRLTLVRADCLAYGLNYAGRSGPAGICPATRRGRLIRAKTTRGRLCRAHSTLVVCGIAGRWLA
ncbi:hypothetical protein Bca52824_016885 [Brassica carinata]|uniref:Uncharacterized protein n=1 Tax=Brassica carinata TaxID=52824 RepID=A0A8X7W5Z5_BRACI|nr:hypothetical protein Bca52824_016885 [Brassica carinata]